MPEKRTEVNVVRVTLQCPLCVEEMTLVGRSWDSHSNANRYHYICLECKREEQSDLEYPFNEYVAKPTEEQTGRLVNPAGAVITPQAREAIQTLILTTLDQHTPDNWTLNWESPFEKFIPSYNHQTGQWSLRGTRHAQCAPAEWHRPQSAWDAVIRLYPEELKVFMEIL